MHIVEDYVDDDFYLTKDLNDKQMKLLDKVIQTNPKSLSKYNKRIVESAEMSGKKSKDVTLLDNQVVPMLMSIVTKRFFIGDEPGLGKTIMSASCYANYKYHMIRNGKTPTKVMVVTTSSHVHSFAKEWASYGIDLLPLSDGSLKIEKKLEEEDIDDYDGIAINWDGLKTNAFLDFYMRNHEKIDYAVFDETGVLKKNTSMLYKTVNNLVNKYGKGIDRVIFLNGSSFESKVFDFYYQFMILQPKLIPNKQFLEDNYVIRGGASVFAMNHTQIKNRGSGMLKYTGEIKSYKNQTELRERLKYYYVARSKADYSTELPSKNYIMHLVEMTPKQRKLIKEEKNATLLNSPKTRDEKHKMTLANAPKLKELIEFAQMVEQDRPLIYVYNIESQKTVKAELDKLGYRTEILNGNVTPDGKSEIVDQFNNGKLDMLVFNIQRAISIPTSDRILFYDIPIMPHETRQVTGRIDRNNYDTPKFFDFFCYLESPEMENILRLSLFRESEGVAFTGQESYIYQTIINQLELHYGEEKMQEIRNKSEQEDDFFDSEEWELVLEDLV